MREMPTMAHVVDTTGLYSYKSTLWCIMVSQRSKPNIPFLDTVKTSHVLRLNFEVDPIISAFIPKFDSILYWNSK